MELRHGCIDIWGSLDSLIFKRNYCFKKACKEDGCSSSSIASVDLVFCRHIPQVGMDDALTHVLHLFSSFAYLFHSFQSYSSTSFFPTLHPSRLPPSPIVSIHHRYPSSRFSRIGECFNLPSFHSRLFSSDICQIPFGFPSMLHLPLVASPSWKTIAIQIQWWTWPLTKINIYIYFLGSNLGSNFQCYLLHSRVTITAVLHHKVGEQGWHLLACQKLRALYNELQKFVPIIDMPLAVHSHLPCISLCTCIIFIFMLHFQKCSGYGAYRD